MMSVTRVIMVYSIFLIFTSSGSPPVEGKLVSDDHVLPPRRRVVTRVAAPAVYSDTILPPRRKVLTRVVPRTERDRRVHVTHEVHHVVHKKKPRRRVRPITVVSDGVSSGRVFDGSYVAVSGTNGRGAVHVVENVPALGRDSVSVINGVRVRYQPNKRVVQVVGDNRGVVQVVPDQRVVQVVGDNRGVQVVGRRVPPPVVHPSTRVVGGAREVVLAGGARDTQVVVDRRQNTPQVVVQPIAVPYPVGQGGLLPNQQTPASM